MNCQEIHLCIVTEHPPQTAFDALIRSIYCIMFWKPDVLGNVWDCYFSKQSTWVLLINSMALLKSSKHVFVKLWLMEIRKLKTAIIFQTYLLYLLPIQLTFTRWNAESEHDKHLNKLLDMFNVNTKVTESRSVLFVTSLVVLYILLSLTVKWQLVEAFVVWLIWFYYA